MGNLNQKGAYGAYAYKIPFNNSRLSLGLQAGITRYRSDFSELPIYDKGDPVFADHFISETEPAFGTGLFYSGNQYYIGFSMPQLLKLKLKEKFSHILQQRKLFLQGGYSFPVNDDLKLNPSFLYILNNGNRSEYNFNINLLIMDVIWAGILYRNFSTYSLLSKIHLNQQLQLGYAYDMMTNELAYLDKTSHEIMLKYTFIYEQNNIRSPRYF